MGIESAACLSRRPRSRAQSPASRRPSLTLPRDSAACAAAPSWIDHGCACTQLLAYAVEAARRAASVMASH